MDDASRAIRHLMDEISSDLAEEQYFSKQLQRHSTWLRSLVFLLLFLATGVVWMALLAVRGTYPLLTSKVVFAVQMGLFLFFSYQASNWLRVKIQSKIDQSNADQYGNFWSK